MWRTKQHIREDFEAMVTDFTWFPDFVVTVAFHNLCQRWDHNSEIKQEAMELLYKHRPEVAADIDINGPVTIFVKGTMLSRPFLG